MNKILSIFFVFFFAVTSLLSAANAQPANKMKAKITHLAEDFPITELDNSNWKEAKEIVIEKYWSGEKTPLGRQAKARLLWSANALYVRFEAAQSEPLIVSEKPNLSSKTKGLWDRDVCEIFLAPNVADYRHYFEFEIAPSGEFIDLGIHQMPDKRDTDWDYDSKMKSSAKIEKDKIVMAIKIEWKAFGKTPKRGDVWLGNIFRCVGTGETRGYLAWSPTKTKEPSFHVPDAFGKFEFAK